ncbi:hypothetical protein TB2_021818 [Malus domestica]
MNGISPGIRFPPPLSIYSHLRTFSLRGRAVADPFAIFSLLKDCQRF